MEPAPEPADRVEFSAYTIGGIVQATFWLTFAALFLALIVLSLTVLPPPKPGSMAGYVFAVLFCAVVGIWCAVGSRVHLTVSSAGLATKDDEERSSYRWPDLDRIAAIGEGRGARLVIWTADADPGTFERTVLALGPLDRKYGPARIRTTLREFAGDCYVERPG